MEETVGSQRLGKYLDRKGITLEAFAARVGTTKSAVWSWREGKKFPRTKHAVLIHRATGIPPSAWLRPVR